jgi:hypothetical protein
MEYNRQSRDRAEEWLSGKFGHEVIAISKIIQDILKKRCPRVSDNLQWRFSP